VVQTMLEDPAYDLVNKIRGHLSAYVDGRPHIIRLDTTGLSEEDSYHRLLEVLDERNG
jgi:hypothetical protein